MAAASHSVAKPGATASSLTRVCSTGRVHRMAYLGASSDAGGLHLQRALFDALRDFGYVEGENLFVERRFSEGDYDQLETLASELATLNLDIVFVIGTQAALAASRAISQVPVVFAAVAYPVAMGLVRSLWEPGTNRTGVAYPSDVLCRQRVQILKEMFPKAKQVAVVHNSRNAVEALMLSAIDEASVKLKLSLALKEVKSEADFEPTFEALRHMRPDALYIIESPLNFVHRSRIVRNVSSARLAAIYGFAEFAEAGGLMSYSFNLAEHFRASAGFIHRIFSGAKASSLPVEVPTTYELVINLKTARAQGLTFPQAILARADRVIE